MAIGIRKTIQRRQRRPRLWNSGTALLTDATLFFLGTAGAYSVPLVGSFPGNEILLFPLLPGLLLAKGKRAFSRQYLWFYLLAGAWLLGTILGDVYNESPLNSRMKGIARIVFFTFDFMALAILINNKAQRFIMFALSIVVVMLFIARYFPGEFLTQWKFGFSSALIITSLLLSSYFYSRRRYWICFGISLALAASNLYFAFRSQLAIIFVSAVLTLPIFGQDRRFSRSRNSGARNSFRITVLLALALFSAFLANEAVKFAALQGFFDETVAEKFKTQSEGKLGVLFGGRPETLVAIQAILDRPIIGHGSFAVDQHYIELKQDIQYKYGYTDTDTPEDIKDPGIPTHSHLTNAWVESGILGGLFWLYVLALTARGILRITEMRPNLAPLYCYLLVNFLWDIMYSPFGNVNRIWGAYLILMSYSVLNTPKDEATTHNPRKRVIVSSQRHRGRLDLASRRVRVHARPSTAAGGTRLMSQNGSFEPNQ